MTGERRGGAAAAWLGFGLGAIGLLLLIPLGAAWQIAPDLGHGWAAPLLIGYLYWERWSERPASGVAHFAGGFGWLIALGVAGAALPLRLLLAPFPLWPALIWAYALLLIGCALAGAAAGWGRAGVLWLGGPLIVLAGALPWPSELDQTLILPLRAHLAAIAAECCNLLGCPALAEGTSVRLGHDWIGVEEACGGIRSLQAAVMVGLFLGEWRRFNWLRRAALVVIGMGAAVLGNFSRILFLALRAAKGPEAAASAHDAAGWLALALTLGLTGAAAWRWSTPPPARRSAPRMPAGPRAPAAVVRWLAVAAVALLLEEGGVRWWYWQGEAATRQIPRWSVHLPEAAWNFQAVPLADSQREMLRPDLYLAGAWEGEGNLGYSAYYIEWRGGQIARFVPFLHNPTVCLPMAGCELERELGDFAVRWSGGEIPFHAYVFREAGRDLTVAFAVWDTGRNRPMSPDTSSDRWSWLRNHWEEVREARRDQPAQMLSLAITGSDGQSELASTLQSLIVAR